MSHLWFCAVTLAAALLGLGCDSEGRDKKLHAPVSDHRDVSEIDRLVGLLHSDDFEERETASQRLEALRVASVGGVAEGSDGQPRCRGSFPGVEARQCDRGKALS